MRNRLEQLVPEGQGTPPNVLAQPSDQLVCEQSREGRDTPPILSQLEIKLVGERLKAPQPPRTSERGTMVRFAKGLLQLVCAMILPQVHLRKPCYDFSFL